MSRARALEAAVILGLVAAGVALRFRIAEGWLFAGSDSYGYLKLADELWQHGRYALGMNEPLAYGRPPLYPIFLALVKREHTAAMTGGDGWFRITHAQIWLDVAVLPLLYFLARRLAGVWAACAALALGALCPLSLIYTSVVLTESLAATLTIAAFGAIVLGRTRPRVWFTVAGVLVGLSTLLRPDGIFLALPLGLGIVALREGWAEKRRVAIYAALGMLVYAPWPVRNLVAFGHAYPFGVRVDRQSHELHNDGGYWHWMASWAPDFAPETLNEMCFYSLACPPLAARYPSFAFDSPEERTTVDALFDKRARGGLTPEVDDGFEALARAHTLHHPLRVLIGLPAQRVYHMWISFYDEALQNSSSCWPFLLNEVRPRLLSVMMILAFTTLLGTAVLLCSPSTRVAGAQLGGWILVRSAFLGVTLHAMPRYTTQMIPIAFVVASAGTVKLVRQIATWRFAAGSAA